MGELNEADNLRAKCKMSEGRFWDLTVQVLISADKLSDAVSYVNRVPPPNSDCGGYKTVARCLVKIKRDDLALPFIRKLKKPKQQAAFFTQLGLHEEARLAEQKSNNMAGLFGKLTGGFMMGGIR